MQERERERGGGVSERGLTVLQSPYTKMQILVSFDFPKLTKRKWEFIYLSEREYI